MLRKTTPTKTKYKDLFPSLHACLRANVSILRLRANVWTACGLYLLQRWHHKGQLTATTVLNSLDALFD
jgi:hypothetical protein